MDDDFGAVQHLCSNCREEVTIDGRFCKSCAFELSNSESKTDFAPATSTQTRDKDVKKGIMPIVLGGFGLLLLGSLGLVFFLRSGTQGDSLHSNTFSLGSTVPSLSGKAQQAEEKLLQGAALEHSDIEGLTTQELRILRNAHFARYGRKYERPGLGDYFFTRSWYKPSETYKDEMLTSVDKANVKLILSVEKPEVVISNPTPFSSPDNPSPESNLQTSLIEPSPGQTVKIYLTAIDSGDYERIWNLFEYDPATERFDEATTRANTLKALRFWCDPMRADFQRKGGLKEVTIHSESVNGDTATVYFTSEFYNGFSKSGEWYMEKKYGGWATVRQK